VLSGSALALELVVLVARSAWSQVPVQLAQVLT